MAEIRLSCGKYAIVDEDDFEYINQWKWYVSNKGYAVRKPRSIRPKTIFMHRIINNTPDGYQTDHINRDKLDNRKSNLRTLNNQRNHFNMPILKNNKSGVTGVSWSKERNKWFTSIVFNGKMIALGRYSSFEEAVIIRKDAERKYHVI